MLWTLICALLVLWILGLMIDVLGGLIHLLLVIAVAVFLLRMIQGRRPAR